MGCDVCPNAHVMTLKFHRFLTEVEWRVVAEAARLLPLVAEIEGHAVIETPEELARRRSETTLDASPEKIVENT